MTQGKNICKQLKEVRKRIAEENGIPLEIKECTYKGECRGTCPRCEAEVRYLENALANRMSLGKVATVAGLALGLAVPGTIAAQDTVRRDEVKIVKQMASSIKIKGQVIDIETREPLPFVAVIAIDSTGKVVIGASTDFDGYYTLKVPEGRYTIQCMSVGYYRLELPVDNYTKDLTLPTIEMKTSAILSEGIVIIEDDPVIEIGPTGGINTEIQGVKVKVQ
ncbi:MAG: carboxypeptidase-like regulatory domain-containing protein [Bacteroidales bacterium]|nr:carboxypeptidase-like regulatory domain-containing protein [Bacteroidales bacterium]